MTISAHARSTNAPHSGYQRIEMAGCDRRRGCRPPAAAVFSDRAHAGCSSFEFSVGAQRLVVNCGAPDANRGRPRGRPRA